MRYSYEFKLMCVELYHSGLYPDIPEDTNPDTLKRHIREWSGLVDLHGPEVLKHKVFNKVWTPEEKLELVLKVIAGIPKRKVAIEAGINSGMLYQWVYKVIKNEEVNKSITFNRIRTRRTDALEIGKRIYQSGE